MLEKQTPEETNLTEDKELNQDMLKDVSAAGNPYVDIARIKEHLIEKDIIKKG